MGCTCHHRSLPERRYPHTGDAACPHVVMFCGIHWTSSIRSGKISRNLYQTTKEFYFINHLQRSDWNNYSKLESITRYISLAMASQTQVSPDTSPMKISAQRLSFTATSNPR
jgi:hypothetical protein